MENDVQLIRLFRRKELAHFLRSEDGDAQK